MKRVLAVVLGLVLLMQIQSPAVPINGRNGRGCAGRYPGECAVSHPDGSFYRNRTL